MVQDSPSLRQVVSRALVLCGRRRITSLLDDREDVAVAREMMTNVINTCLSYSFFHEGEKEIRLTLVPEEDRTSSNGVQYYLPSDFVAVRNVFNGLCSIDYQLEGNFLLLPGEVSEARMLYVADSTIRYRDLFIRYASYMLAVEIVQAVGNRELAPLLGAQYELVRREVAALSYDSSSWGRGKQFFTRVFRR